MYRPRRALFLALFGAPALIAATGVSFQDRVAFNHSPSLPIGLYVRVNGPIPSDAIAPGMFVTVRARDVAPAEAERRGFADKTDRFLKRVAAISGDPVCAEGARIRIKSLILPRRTHARDGRALDLWTGCRRLAADEMLLLGDGADSFDGRYWGPTSKHLIEGIWRKWL